MPKGLSMRPSSPSRKNSGTKVIITMSVASSRGYGSLIELLEMMKVRHYFALVVGVDNVDKAKPDPEAVLYIIKAMEVDANDVLMVGDMPVDIAMGQNAGTRTCAVTYGNSSKEELEKTRPDYLIDRMDQLIGCSELASS